MGLATELYLFGEKSFFSREILKPAIVISAYSCVMVHNHPSGDPSPSEADMAPHAPDQRNQPDPPAPVDRSRHHWLTGTKAKQLFQL